MPAQPAADATGATMTEEDYGGMMIKMTLCGHDMDVPPAKLKATFERLIAEHKLEDKAGVIADRVVDSLTGKGESVEPSKLASELKIEEEEAGVMLAWLHFIFQVRMKKLSEAQAAEGARSAREEGEPLFKEDFLRGYEAEKQVGWFAQFDDVAETLAPKLKSTDKILLVCCEDSFAEALTKAGYSDVTRVGLDAALSKLPFSKETFDVVIERTVVDDLMHLCKEDAHIDSSLKNLWCEVFDVLRAGGSYFSLNVTPRDARAKWMKDWSEQISIVIQQIAWQSIDEFTFRVGDGAGEEAQKLQPVGFVSVKGNGQPLLSSQNPPLD